MRRWVTSSKLFRSLLAPAAVTLAMGSLGGCRDENDPMTYVEELKDPVKQPVAIKRLIQFYEDAMTKDKKERSGPHVKPLLDQIVAPMNDTCLDTSLQPRVRSTVIKFLADVQDARAEPCMKKTLEDFKPDAGEEDVQNVMRTVTAMKAKTLAPQVMKVFTTLKFSKPKAKLIGKDVTAAVLAIASPQQEDELLKLLEAPIDPKVEENVHDQAFWQSVAVRALGDIKSAKAVRPFIKIILSPSKAAVANTALVGLVKIGKAAVAPAEALLKGEDKELADYSKTELLLVAEKDKDGKIPAPVQKAAEKAYLSTAAQILGALGSESSIGPLVGELAKLEKAEKVDEAETRVIISLVLPLLPRSKATVAAYQTTFKLSKMDLEVPGVGRAKELLVDGASDFFDPSMSTWLVESTTNPDFKGDAEDLDAIRQYAFLAAMKTMKPEDIAKVEELSKTKAKGTDKAGKEIVSTVGAAYEKEWNLSKDLLKNCEAKLDCYLAKLTDEKSQEKATQFTGIKAAYMVAILGDDSTRLKIVDAIPRITNAAVRQASLKALQSLSPKGDEAAASKLLGYLEKAEEAKDDELIKQYGVFTQVAASLRARAQ